MASASLRDAGLDKERAERVWAGDVDGLIALYEPGGIIGRMGGDPAIGHEAIRAELRRLIDGKVTIDLTIRSVLEAGGLALVSHHATITQPDGTTTVVDTTEVTRRQTDGRWLYAIDDPFVAHPPA
ncbi:nuclear transport factor 2 family protein [Streptomyces sp. Rer75]|uniref:YybH family protein n=1 Tax=unclassified Streptomyces TaxID=2593676 RepID=UPI001C54E671|nr:nuclear transport factor 2 family protein [Streptomyces sp. Rer75]